nr:GH32 C-terminal domain-containing protein [Bacteroides propionicifaciens]
MPLDLREFKGQSIAMIIENASSSAKAWDNLKVSDTFDRKNTEHFRPIFHFSPDYGWMNDPNGMVYHNGTYHLCFQYNPYGSTWENMSWGHATTKDLITWTHQADALHKDGLSDMFSGGAVIDKNNVSGLGKDAIIAFYTNAGIGQTQCIAYSLDNGNTFTKYKNNPILTSSEPDFRDPKVFWHEATDKWIMILAVGQHMEIYNSDNFLDWTYKSSFGEGEGSHGGVWECPDLVQLPVEGTQKRKWLLICNINPGGPFGGSAAQYFVGSFDGERFTNEAPVQTKWMDYGKDYYATVTWSNTPDNRVIALGWMSNWQYGNQLPTKQYRSATAIPRDLKLFEHEGQTYLKSEISKGLNPFLHKISSLEGLNVNKDETLENITKGAKAYQVDMELKNESADKLGFKLFNDKGDGVSFYIDAHKKTLKMDRTKSGLTDFDPTLAYMVKTIAPLFLKDDLIKLTLLVDTCSIEVFGNGGRFTMTNLVFPQEQFNNIHFFSYGGDFEVKSISVQEIKTK